MPPLYITAFEPSSTLPVNCADWQTDDTLPQEIEGIVTLHPRWYVKVSGCLPADDDSRFIDSDEKYYGSYFIEDQSGGVFVLGDAKVAHFNMGDRVRMTVRSVANNFDLQMVTGHDILEVTRGPEPIYYQTVSDGKLCPDDVASVRRVTGTVFTDPDTFGEFTLESDDGNRHIINLDAELNRRGIRYPIGTRLTVTGPVLFSYGSYAIVVIRVGQIEVLSED
jgi:hypothetical protein